MLKLGNISYRHAVRNTDHLMPTFMNNPTKLHPDPIWNDGAFGFFEEVAQRQQQQQQQQQQEQEQQQQQDE